MRERGPGPGIGTRWDGCPDSRGRQRRRHDIAWQAAPPPTGIARGKRAQGVPREAQMAVLCDTQIRELVGIEPFEDSDKPRGD